MLYVGILNSINWLPISVFSIFFFLYSSRLTFRALKICSLLVSLEYHSLPQQIRAASPEVSPRIFNELTAHASWMHDLIDKLEVSVQECIIRLHKMSKSGSQSTCWNTQNPNEILLMLCRQSSWREAFNRGWLEGPGGCQTQEAEKTGWWVNWFGVFTLLKADSPNLIRLLNWLFLNYTVQ